MIVTPDFIFVHHPKTGGTFVTEILSRVYGDRPGAFVNLDVPSAIAGARKHGTCSDIPAWCGHKPIVSAVRNPFDRYVSQYRFRWWQLHPDGYCGAEEMRALYPHYPDITFAQFVHLANTKFLAFDGGHPTAYVNRNLPPGRELGWQTREFVRYFFREPHQAYARLDEESIQRDTMMRLMYPVRFLPAERLNEALYDLLLECGHPPARIDFIRSADKIFPAEGGRDAGDRWENYYTPEVREFIRVRERLLFELFPQYDCELFPQNDAGGAELHA